MPARLAQIATAASRLALAALSLTLAATPIAAAQQTERLCRIVYSDAMKGRVDPSSTEGAINLGPKMPQPGGGFMMMGQGRATVTYGAEGQVLAGGCRVTSNRVFEYPVSAVVTSEDGANGEVDIIPGVFSYKVKMFCSGPQGGNLEQDMTLMVPPTVTLPMVRGASQTYVDGDNRARLEGTMSLELCRAEPQ